jgi:hypothetical protein
VFPKWLGLLPEIEQRFPGGAAQNVTGKGGQVEFTTYTLFRPPPS